MSGRGKLSSKECSEGKILNPTTRRCVKIDGAIGKQLLASKKRSPIKTKPTMVGLFGEIGDKIWTMGPHKGITFEDTFQQFPDYNKKILEQTRPRLEMKEYKTYIQGRMPFVYKPAPPIHATATTTKKTAVPKTKSKPKASSEASPKRSPAKKVSNVPEGPTEGPTVLHSTVLNEFITCVKLFEPVYSNFSSFTPSVLDIKVTKEEKFFGLYGKDLLFIKNSVPLNERKKPIYSYKYGYMYFSTASNQAVMAKWHECSRKINEKYKGYTIKKDEKPLDKMYGIIGYDIAFTLEPWVSELLPGSWDDQLNPRLEPNGTITYQKCAINIKVYDRAMALVQKKGAFLNIYPKIIFFSKNTQKLKELQEMIESPQYIAGEIGWASHARFFYKDDKNKMIYLYDPWKASAGRSDDYIKIARAVKDLGYDIKFIARATKDQGSEGSCLAAAFSRVLMMSHYGIDGATRPLDLNYVIFTSRLISKVR